MPEKVAFIYQGLTSHHAERYEKLRQNRTASRWLQRANRTVSDIGLLDRLTDPKAYLDPEFASVANFAAATAVTQILFESMGMEKPAITTGNSHGLIIAVKTADGYTSFEEGLRFSRERGRHMGTIPGGVVALGTNAESAGEILQKVWDANQPLEGEGVYITHLNSPTQTVVGGTQELLAAVSKFAMEDDIKAYTGLVSPPSHTPLMEPILDDICKLTEPIIVDTTIPLVANSDASIIRTARDIKKELRQQLVEPVDWIRGITTIYECGVEKFILIAPGSDSGAKMIQQIVPGADVFIAGPTSLYKPNGGIISSY